MTDSNTFAKPSGRSPRAEQRHDGYAFTSPENVQMDTLDVERRGVSFYFSCHWRNVLVVWSRWRGVGLVNQIMPPPKVPVS